MMRTGSPSIWLFLGAIIVTTHVLAGFHTELLLRRSAAGRAELLTDALLESAEQTLQASHYLEERVSARLRSIAVDIASSAVIPGADRLEEIVRRNEIRSISIYNAAGRVVSSSLSSETATMLPESYGCHEVLHGGKSEHVFGFSEGMFCEADAFGIAMKLPGGGLVRVLADVAFVLGFERSVGLPALIERFRQHHDILRLDLVDMQGKPILPATSSSAPVPDLPSISRTIMLHGKPVGRFILTLDDTTLGALRGAALAAITVSGLLSLGFLLLLRHREFRAEELREQRRLREETERRSEGLARIVSGVAHEIRNPLNTLSLGLDSLLAATASSGEPPSADVSRRFELLKQTVREANGLVQNLLQTTRPILPHPQAFDLAPWLEDLKLAFGTAFPSTRFETPAIGPTPIESDPELLRRLVWNLVANAAQTGAGSVGIALSEDAQSRVLTVSDNGPGLPDQIVEHLFMAGNTTRPDGTGLGLYNAYRLAVALGGSLKLAGTDRSGTSFELRLPAHAQPTGGLHDHVA